MESTTNVLFNSKKEKYLPEKIESLIKPGFYMALYGELCALFGSDAIGKDPSTVGFILAFTEACQKMDMHKFWKYYINKLDADGLSYVSQQIMQRLLDSLKVADSQSINPYYGYMLRKHWSE